MNSRVKNWGDFNIDLSGADVFLGLHDWLLPVRWGTNCTQTKWSRGHNYHCWAIMKHFYLTSHTGELLHRLNETTDTRRKMCKIRTTGLYCQKTCKQFLNSGGSRIFQRRTLTPGGHELIWPNFPQNSMKMKKFSPQKGRGRPLRSPSVDPPMPNFSRDCEW